VSILFCLDEAVVDALWCWSANHDERWHVSSYAMWLYLINRRHICTFSDIVLIPTVMFGLERYSIIKDVKINWAKLIEITGVWQRLRVHYRTACYWCFLCKLVWTKDRNMIIYIYF
jgi:hypothetical protein